MFDAGRLLALLWAIFRVARARAPLDGAVLAFAAYTFALEVWSGFTIRGQGAMDPILAVALALLGPTALPRGPLPALPLANLVLRLPAVVNVGEIAALFLVARRRRAHVETLSPFDPATQLQGRAALAVMLVAVFDGLSAVLRLIPEFVLPTI
ncbi:MAG TPA: hypothetical protein VGI39_22870 [Polyangiaceae bacterium]